MDSKCCDNLCTYVLALNDIPHDHPGVKLFPSSKLKERFVIYAVDKMDRTLNTLAHILSLGHSSIC